MIEFGDPRQRTKMNKPATKATVIPIDPEGKYILLIDFGSLNEEQKVIAKRKFMGNLQEWWASDNPLYVIATFGGSLTLQKVSEDKESP